VTESIPLNWKEPTLYLLNKTSFSRRGSATYLVNTLKCEESVNYKMNVRLINTVRFSCPSVEHPASHIITLHLYINIITQDFRSWYMNMSTCHYNSIKVETATRFQRVVRNKYMLHPHCKTEESLSLGRYSLIRRENSNSSIWSLARDKCHRSYYCYLADAV
jgi:hypothetical protein